MDLGFHLSLSYRDLKHPTSRQNFANVVGQNHAQALIITQCLKVFIYPDFLPSEYYCRLRQEPRSQFPQRSDLLSASGTWLSPSHLPDLSDNPDIIWEKDILGEFHLILPENPSRHTWSSSSTHLFIKKMTQNSIKTAQISETNWILCVCLLSRQVSFHWQEWQSWELASSLRSSLPCWSFPWWILLVSPSSMSRSSLSSVWSSCSEGSPDIIQ